MYFVETIDTDGLALALAHQDESLCLREGIDMEEYHRERRALFVMSDADKYTPGLLKLEYEGQLGIYVSSKLFFVRYVDGGQVKVSL